MNETPLLLIALSVGAWDYYRGDSDSKLAKVKAMFAEIPAADLKIAAETHRANCHQPNCPVLAAMEEVANTGSPT